MTLVFNMSCQKVSTWSMSRHICTYVVHTLIGKLSSSCPCRLMRHFCVSNSITPRKMRIGWALADRVTRKTNWQQPNTSELCVQWLFVSSEELSQIVTIRQWFLRPHSNIQFHFYGHFHCMNEETILRIRFVSHNRM